MTTTDKLQSFGMAPVHYIGAESQCKQNSWFYWFYKWFYWLSDPTVQQLPGDLINLDSNEAL